MDRKKSVWLDGQEKKLQINRKALSGAEAKALKRDEGTVKKDAGKCSTSRIRRACKKAYASS